MHVEGFDASQAELENHEAVDAPPVGASPTPAYYLNDFHSVIQGVEQLHGSLLNADEQAYLRKLKALSLPAQQLYARLVNRKGPYFRVTRLAYPEIGVPDQPIAELVAHRLLEICVTLPPVPRQKRLLACFTLPELVAALKNHAAPKRACRAAFLDWLGAWEGFGAWGSRILKEHLVVELPESDPWPFMRFLFFGELRENLSDFVTRALGHIVTESFAPANLHPCFSSRAQADDAYRMARYYQTFAEIRETRPAAELLEWWHGHGIGRHALADGRFWFDRLVDRLGKRLERENEIDAALALYATSPVAPARERQARLLIKTGRPAEAVTLLQTMQATPCHPEEAYTARHLLARLEKRSRRSEAREFQLAGRTITLPYAPRNGAVETAGGQPDMNVEAAVLAYYRAQGWQGVHAENWLWNASFGLLLWDIIYDPALGVFHSPLQFAPSDLYTPDFYNRRQHAIEARLISLQNPLQAYQIISRHCQAKHGLANPFVAWHENLPDILSVMLERVPPDGHAAVLRHMARNFRHHSHGFLDLFIWNAQDYRFIEIKGENDHLAAHQFEWLRFFAEAGIKVSLEKVQRPTQISGAHVKETKSP